MCIRDSLKPAYAQLKELKIARAAETRSTCPYCAVGCGVLIYTIGDRAKNVTPQVIHVEGDPDHPTNRGTPVSYTHLDVYKRQLVCCLRKVIEVEIFRGQQPQLLNELRREKSVPVAFLDNLRRSQDFRQQFRALLIADGPHPTQMIQSQIVEFQFEWISVERMRDRLECFERCITDADHIDSGMIQKSL